MEAAKLLAGELGIEDKVYFLGNHSNVSDYYQAMDYFVYPSRFEGLPGTVVEAQCSGLKCLISDTICEEVAVTELVHTMSIEENPDRWVDYIVETMEYERQDRVQEMQKAGFDVCAQAEKMAEFYTADMKQGGSL